MRDTTGAPVPWTEERVSLVTELWTVNGLSAEAIAKQLGGVTRSAVIGKVYRLGLKRLIPTRKLKGTKKRTKLLQPQRATFAKLPPRNLEEPSPLSVALVDLERHQCRWPTNHGYCGHAKSEHPSYCAYHARLSILRRAA